MFRDSTFSKFRIDCDGSSHKTLTAQDTYTYDAGPYQLLYVEFINRLRT